MKFGLENYENIKLGKVFCEELEFGIHMISGYRWNGWSTPFIKEEDMEEFAKAINDSDFANEEYEQYNTLAFVNGEWVWHEFECGEIVETFKMNKPTIDGVTYYDIQIGFCWSHEEVA